MKKIYLSSAILALVLSACTSEEVNYEGPQSDAIVFQNVVNKNSRALTTQTFGSFWVYGYYTRGNDLNKRFNIFTDTPVSKGADGSWSSPINRYWVNEASYSFYAFSCENNDISPVYGGPSVDQNDGTFRINYTCHSTGGTSHDLVFASALGIVGKEKDNLPVPMQFKHILSKVSMQFISDFPEGYKVQISNISISDFENMGTFTASKNNNSEGTWSGVKYDDNKANTNTFTLNIIGNDVTTTGGDPVVSSECYMIPNHYLPGEGDNPVKIKFNIKLINPALPEETQVIASNTLIGSWHPKWLPGTQYVYTVHLTGNEAGMEQIKFAVGVDDWNEPDADNQPQTINISLDYQINPASETEGE